MHKHEPKKTEWRWDIPDDVMRLLDSQTRAIIKHRIRKTELRRTIHGLPDLGKHVTIEVSRSNPHVAKAHLNLHAPMSPVAQDAMAILEDPQSTYLQAVVVSSRGISIQVVQYKGAGKVYRHVQDKIHDVRLTLPADVRSAVWLAASNFLESNGLTEGGPANLGMSLLDLRIPAEHGTEGHTSGNTTVSVVYNDRRVAEVEVAWTVLEHGEVSCVTKAFLVRAEATVQDLTDPTPTIHEY